MTGESWEIRINDWHPLSLNRLLRMKGPARTERLALDAFVVRSSWASARIPKAKGRREVSVFFGWRAEEIDVPDPDNSLKAIMDGLKLVGAIIDDNFKNVRLGRIDGQPGDHNFTRISLVDIPSWA